MEEWLEQRIAQQRELSISCECGDPIGHFRAEGMAQETLAELRRRTVMVDIGLAIQLYKGIDVHKRYRLLEEE